jgi:hypothetical protein
MDFIRSLISRLKHHDASGNDEELRKAFESYTLMTVDLALVSDEHSTSITHD